MKDKLAAKTNEREIRMKKIILSISTIWLLLMTSVCASQALDNATLEACREVEGECRQSSALVHAYCENHQGKNRPAYSAETEQFFIDQSEFERKINTENALARAAMDSGKINAACAANKNQAELLRDQNEHARKKCGSVLDKCVRKCQILVGRCQAVVSGYMPAPILERCEELQKNGRLKELANARDNAQRQAASSGNCGSDTK